MIYLRGTGGTAWPFNVDSHAALPEYARHQLKTGDLVEVEAPEVEAVSSEMDRPLDNASKDQWAKYIRSFDQDLPQADVHQYTKRDLIQWANELEVEEVKRNEPQGS